MEWSEDSLTTKDCLDGLEAALCHGWLHPRGCPGRGGVALAYDAAPIFALVLDEDGQHVRVDCWVAADPVTTVVDPATRPEPPEDRRDSS